MIFKVSKPINFSKHYKRMNIFSFLLLIISFLLILFKGLNFGVDFKGGTLIELRIDNEEITISDVRSSFLQMNLGDVNVKEFEKFALEEYNPSFNRAVPGSRNFITKSDRGIDVDSYALIITFDSQIVRNAMIPEQGSSDWLNTIMEENGLWSLWNKLGTYVTEESMSNYNDFVELR